ncbi:ATP-binding protein [Salinifilum ghardaiensis]
MVSIARARPGESSGNLPADVTTFVGRRREITATKRLLAESRVVTLTGPGGVGKTRLALRVAANMRRTFRDKAWFVQLEDLRDGALVPDAVVEQLGLGGPSTSDVATTVVEHLRHREALLVLDNCEHVVDAVAQLTSDVIRWCPGVRVLATSRQSIGIAGESTMVVPPLQVPDVDHLPPPEAYEQFASVRLFVDRARAAVPEFEVNSDNAPALMRLCHHLDGNPLAIEMAAVRLRSLSPQQLEQRLAQRYDVLAEGRRSAPPRQRTLRALVDWSWELCSEADQRAWSRVSVFSGGFDLEAAEHVCGDGWSETDVLRTLHSLVDQSVLAREEVGDVVRYRLPHTLREYGQERLAESGEQERIAHRHRAWYQELAARFAAEWVGPEQVEWVERIRRDQSNLRVALHTAAGDAATTSTALRMAAELSTYWAARGLVGEARHWLQIALEGAPADDPERGPALRLTAWFALLQGDTAAADGLLHEAEDLLGGDESSAPRAHLALIRGLRLLSGDDLDGAAAQLEQSLSGYRRGELVAGQLSALFLLGLTRGLRGEVERGLGLIGENIQISAERGELFWRSYALWAAAHVNFQRGKRERAEEAAKDALRMQRRMDNRLGMAFALDTLAWIARRQGRSARAARLFGAAAAAWEAVRAQPGFYATFARTHAEEEHAARQDLGETAFQEAFDRGYHTPHGQAIDLALESKKHTRARSENVHPMPLTRRERQIADLVAEGKTNKEIAEGLVIAQRTVEGHVQNILTKLDFTSRAQIAGWVAGQRADEASHTESQDR